MNSRTCQDEFMQRMMLNAERHERELIQAEIRRLRLKNTVCTVIIIATSVAALLMLI